MNAPVIAIDGPAGSGKGTVAALVAARLGWHLLDSGALYRGLGQAALAAGIDPDDGAALGALAARIELRFVDARLLLDGEDISARIRSEPAGLLASRVARHAPVRAALRAWQRAAARPPGLVADGRDMGTAVFPEARVKVYLDATLAERARRRYNQLKEKGMDANLADLVEELRARDERDLRRAHDPLAIAPDATAIDTTNLSITAVLAQVMTLVARVMGEGGDGGRAR